MPQVTLRRQPVGQTLHHEHEKRRRTGLSELVFGVYSRIPPAIALPLTPASRPRHSRPLRTALQLSGSTARPVTNPLLPNYRTPAARPYPRVPPHTGYATLRSPNAGSAGCNPDFLTRS